SLSHRPLTLCELYFCIVRLLPPTLVAAPFARTSLACPCPRQGTSMPSTTLVPAILIILLLGIPLALAVLVSGLPLRQLRWRLLLGLAAFLLAGAAGRYLLVEGVSARWLALLAGPGLILMLPGLGRLIVLAGRPCVQGAAFLFA